MNESQPAGILDISVDLAWHDVAREFCAGLGEVDEGGGELALYDRPIHSDLWGGAVNTRIGGTKVTYQYQVWHCSSNQSIRPL